MTTPSVITRERFLAIEATHVTHALPRLYYIAAENVEWITEDRPGKVTIRFGSGQELQTLAEPIKLCARLEAMLTQRLDAAKDEP